MWIKCVKSKCCYYRNCFCSFQIDCECEPYEDYEVSPECEIEITRQEEEDLRKELDRLRNEIMCIKDKIPLQLKDVAQKISLSYLLYIY